MIVRRLLMAAAAALTLTLAPATPAGAVSNGTPDTTHPYVGTLVLRLPDTATGPAYHYWCSGTLVALPQGTLGLVANGHCFDAVLRAQMYPGSTMLGMTLAPTVATDTAPSGVVVGQGHRMSSYPGPDYTNDVGVYVVPAASIPAEVRAVLPHLPYAGQLDDLRAAGDLIGTQATIVGYGVGRSATGGTNGVDWLGGGTRQSASERVSGISPDRLRLASIAALGAAGPCVGDSGAPRLLQGDTLLAAVSGFIGGMCQSPERALRLDRPDILAFLANPTTGAAQ